GLDRFTHSNVVRDAAPPCAQNEFMSARSAVAAGDEGALWVACNDGYVTHVDEVREGTVVSSQITPEFTVSYRDRQGTVWFAGPTAIGHIENGKVVTTTLPPNLYGRPVQALVRDTSGGIWASVTRRGLFRFLDGEWSEYGGLAGLPGGFATVATVDSDGTLWF